MAERSPMDNWRQFSLILSLSVVYGNFAHLVFFLSHSLLHTHSFVVLLEILFCGFGSRFSSALLFDGHRRTYYFETQSSLDCPKTRGRERDGWKETQCNEIEFHCLSNAFRALFHLPFSFYFGSFSFWLIERERERVGQVYWSMGSEMGGGRKRNEVAWLSGLKANHCFFLRPFFFLSHLFFFFFHSFASGCAVAGRMSSFQSGWSGGVEIREFHSEINFYNNHLGIGGLDIDYFSDVLSFFRAQKRPASRFTLDGLHTQTHALKVCDDLLRKITFSFYDGDTFSDNIRAHTVHMQFRRTRQGERKAVADSESQLNWTLIQTDAITSDLNAVWTLSLAVFAWRNS